VQIGVTDSYLERIVSAFGQGSLRVVLDCGNGTMSEIAPAAFAKLGYDVKPLYCQFDGRFPNRDPNPAVYKNLRELQDEVVKTGAAFGAAFDGDGDRVVFVDDRGRVVQSERSLVVFIKEYLKSGPSSVVYDLKSSSVVRDAILEMGGKPVMERSGHAFIKRKFLEKRSKLAGEISGHFFFGELGYDDGLYASLRMAQIIGRSGKKLSEIVDLIPETLITPDIRVFCPYERQDEWLSLVEELGKDLEISRIDGVRVQFPDGWLLVRKSVTEEGVTIRCEAKNEEAMTWIKSLLTDTLPELKGKI
jgi:phosphomannomutase/phosphoglucomutase